MALPLALLVFLISLTVLVKAAEYFTVASERVGRAFRIPQFIIGVTVVAIGTSLPELATSLSAVFHGTADVVISNVVGSNITNVLLVTGIVTLVAGSLVLQRNLIDADLPLFALATAVFLVLTLDGVFTWRDGVVTLIGYAIFATYSAVTTREHRAGAPAEEMHRPAFPTRDLALLLVSAAVVGITAHYLIVAVIALAAGLHISTSLVALTAIAVGTSLPEVLVSVHAARRKNYELALGNIVGSNVFNILVVTAVPSFFTKLPIATETAHIGIPFLLLASLLFIISGISRKIYRWEGAFLVLLAVAYFGLLFQIL